MFVSGKNGKTKKMKEHNQPNNTNFYTEFLKYHPLLESKLKTVELDLDEKRIAYFCELSQIKPYPFCINLISNKKGEFTIHTKVWNSLNDIELLKKGKLTPETLDFKFSKHIITPVAVINFRQILEEIYSKKMPASLQASKGISLSTTTFQFGLNNNGVETNYKWKSANANIIHFEQLIEALLKYKT